jgi:hypothetical protein
VQITARITDVTQIICIFQSFLSVTEMLLASILFHVILSRKEHVVAQLLNGTALQAGRSRFRLPMVSLEFFIDNLSGRTMAPGSTERLTEISIKNISCGQKRPVRWADNLITFMCRLSVNLEASTPWNPQGLSRPLQRLLYLCFI